MGALTFKPHSFQTRPWELTSLEVPDYYDDEQPLIFHYRGSLLVQITSTGWLRDRVRFSYDGFRRQRLLSPTLYQQKISWSAAVINWYNFVYQRNINLVSDPIQPHLWWLTYLLGRLARLVSPSSSAFVYSIDVNRTCQIYQGSYGLAAASQASLVLPLSTPYEENNFQHFALSLIQVFRPSYFIDFKGSYQVKYQFNVVRGKSSVSSFQVSPLQRLFIY